MRNQWNTPVPWVPSTAIFEKAYDSTLHPKPIIPIFAETFLWFLTYPVKRLKLSTL